MEFDELKSVIRRRANIDIEPALARYKALAPSPSLDGLLRYLRDQRVIDTKLFTELHTAEKVDATNVEPKSFALGATLQSTPSTGPSASSASAASGDLVATNVSATPTGMTEGPVVDEPIHTDSYEVLGALGKGAMGAVHLARDIFLRRKVALKTILPAMQQNQALFSRFLGEMQITAQLDHPFIVPVYGVENMPDGGVGYAMKLVQGRELADLLSETRQLIEEKKPLDAEHSLEGRLEAFLKVCDALAYAHERGVVHRDLKPANIMIGKFNEVYVMDWGIARLMGKGHPGQDVGVEMYDASGSDVRQTTRTHVGSTIGTPIYMSPEQAAGRNDELDGRSDLYSLGLVLQEIITLKGAVGGTTLQEVLTNAKGARRLPPRPPAPGIEVPRELRAIIDKATCLKPEDRYPSVTHFADDIRRFLRNEAVLAQPDTAVQRAGRWVSKHRMATIAALLLVLVIGAGATIGELLYSRKVSNEQHTRELRLAELQASSAMRAQDLDAQLGRFENELTRLDGAAGLALGEHRTGGDGALHYSDEFKAGSKTAPGLIDSPFYGGLVSFDLPVASLAPGSSKETAEAQMAAVDGLRTLARSIMLESFDPGYRTMSEADRMKALADLGVPISRISLTLESGLHVEYPGRAGLAPDYDGRKEPAYQAASQKTGLTWGAAEKRKDGSVALPCSAALRDVEGKLLGVLTFEVDPNRAVAASLDAGEGGYVESSLLVETNGNLLAQKNERGASPEGEVLSLPDVREAMKRGERGYLQTQRQGHQVLVTYQPLSTVGWYVVTIANLDLMKHAATKEGEHAGSVAPVVSSAKAAPKPMGKMPPPLPPPTAEATAEPSASAAESASAEPSATPPPALTGKLSDLQKAASAAPAVSASSPPPPPPPPNPFDPWKAYEKK